MKEKIKMMCYKIVEYFLLGPEYVNMASPPTNPPEILPAPPVRPPRPIPPLTRHRFCAYLSFFVIMILVAFLAGRGAYLSHDASLSRISKMAMENIKPADRTAETEWMIKIIEETVINLSFGLAEDRLMFGAPFGVSLRQVRTIGPGHEAYATALHSTDEAKTYMQPEVANYAKDAWQFNEGTNLETVVGRECLMPSGGFVIDFPYRKEDFISEAMDELRVGNWIDNNTSVIIMSTTLVDMLSETEALCRVTVVWERFSPNSWDTLTHITAIAPPTPPSAFKLTIIAIILLTFLFIIEWFYGWSVTPNSIRQWKFWKRNLALKRLLLQLAADVCMIVILYCLLITEAWQANNFGAIMAGGNEHTPGLNGYYANKKVLYVLNAVLAGLEGYKLINCIWYPFNFGFTAFKIRNCFISIFPFALVLLAIYNVVGLIFMYSLLSRDSEMFATMEDAAKFPFQYLFAGLSYPHEQQADYANFAIREPLKIFLSLFMYNIPFYYIYYLSYSAQRTDRFVYFDAQPMFEDSGINDGRMKQDAVMPHWSVELLKKAISESFQRPENRALLAHYE